jgi:two-component system, cell cycle response regulator
MLEGAGFMVSTVKKPPRILVIDDSLTIRELIADYLSDSGYILETLDSAEEGWEKICQMPPDLIISDWSLSGLSGIELCQRIRRDPALEHIYFLLLTAREESTDLVAGLDAGADEFITKPIQRQELQARVRAGLRLRHLTQSLIEVNQQLHARNELLASLSLMDALTGVLNRRALETALPGLLQQVGDRQTELFQDSQYILYYRYLSLWIVGIDRFKDLLATHGTIVSDQVLQVVARRLQSNCLPGTLLYRYTDREFVCISLGLDPKRSLEFAESLYLAVSDRPIKLPSGQQLSVTVSMGGQMVTRERMLKWKDLLKAAEETMTQARLSGSNQVLLITEEAMTQ